MFISDPLIYIQMQKTGCTHIASLLSGLFDGEIVGKHNAADETQLQSNRYFISSTRNPWDWYLSLWTFGVQGNGQLMQFLTRKNVRSSVKSIIKNPFKEYEALMVALSKDVNGWIDVYQRNDDVVAFRRSVEVSIELFRLAAGVA